MRFTCLLLFLFISFFASAQSDSAAMAKRDSMIMAMMKAQGMYPLIKTSAFAGVLPVNDISERPDPSHRYPLLVEVVHGIKDSVEGKKMLEGFSEAGRLLNLHVASGIPKSNIDMVLVVHGSALKALYTNQEYRKKYGVDNPNIVLLKELEQNGVRIIACGQAMHFFSIAREQIVPDVHISLTAQTVLSDYQKRGYILYPGN